MKTQKTPSVYIIGLGWLGLALANSLSRKGHSVSGSVSSREKAENISNGIHAHTWQLPHQAPPPMDADCFVYTIPPRGSQSEATQNIRAAAEALTKANIHKGIYLSSTSVYPSENRAVDVSDAVEQPSPHTGIVLKSLEDLWRQQLPQTTVVRLGGLYGPDRHPGRFFRGRPLSRPHANVNMTEQGFAVRHLIRILEKEQFSETFNIISDNEPSRAEFYGQFNPDLKWADDRKEPWKKVLHSEV